MIIMKKMAGPELFVFIIKTLLMILITRIASDMNLTSDVRGSNPPLSILIVTTR
jgi:hypothetical protein